MIENNKNNMQKCAMLFGTYMGSFWIAKFILFPLSLTIPFILFIFIGLTLYVPFLGYRYTKNYRDHFLNGSISFMQAWAFTLLVYVFAALLTSVAHYIYFQFIDHGFIFNTYESLLNELTSPAMAGMEGYVKELQTNLNLIKSLTPLDITLQLISQNIFYGSLLAIPTALFAVRKASNNPTTQL